MSSFLWVAAAAIALVLGQLLLLRPSPHDRVLMELRTAARKQGLAPRLLPVPDWLPVDPGQRLIGCYTLVVGQDVQLPQWRLVRCQSGDWQVQVGPQADVAALLAGPLAPWRERLLAVEASANVISAWWLEAAEPEELKGLKALLEACLNRVQAGR